MPINDQIGKCADITFWRFTSGKNVMPSNQELPPSVRRGLLDHAQQLFRKAFNSAWRHVERE